jgi:toxin ParE1/3/4
MSDEAPGYRLSPLAEADLEDIWLYTRKHWSLAQADRYHHDLIAGIESLAKGIKVGRKADIRAGYFKYSVGQHLIFYRQTDVGLDVIRILHQRMDGDRYL